MANIIKASTEEMNTRTLQMHQMQNIGAYNRMSGDPYDGMLDKNAEVRLRLAMIDNPEIQRGSSDVIDPTDIKKIINVNTGKVALRWLDIPGGVIRPNELDGEWTYKETADSEHPEERTGEEWEISSRREMVSLTHPFIWTGDTNFCGFDYIPPVGSVVVVGFRKQNLPIILGFIPTHYQACNPILKPGEMVMKGYGNNYTHWRWADKIDMKVWSEKGKPDLDDPSKKKINSSSNTLWIRMNANDGFIKLMVGNDGGKGSIINLTPSNCDITTDNFNVIAKNVKINTDDYQLNSTGHVDIQSGANIDLYSSSNTIINAGGDLINETSGNLNINSNNTNINSSGDVNISAGSNSTITAGGVHRVVASKIFLN